MDCARTSWREEGRGVFFKGMTATLTRAFIVNAAVFSVYEFLKELMEDPGSQHALNSEQWHVPTSDVQ